MNWKTKTRKKLNEIVSQPKSKEHRIALEWGREGQDSLHAKLTANGRQLDFRLGPAGQCDCCQQPLLECVLASPFAAIELPCDPPSIHRATQTGCLKTVVKDGRLLVNALAAAFPFDDATTNFELYTFCARTVESANRANVTLLSILGEQSAERCLDGERIARLFQSRKDQQHAFAQWLDTGDTCTPGERLFLALHPDSDRAAAVAWWRKFCDHDHWHKREFIQAFVQTVLARKDKKAA